MNHFKISSFFIGIAAFLYATKHITAAIISSNMNTERANYYDGAYDAVGFGITFWTIFSLIIGVVFFALAIRKYFVKTTKQKDQ